MADRIARLKSRPEFLRVAATRRKWAMPGLVLQAAPSAAAGDGFRYGLTASRKVGGAVVRNRARRRLRALAEAVMPGRALPGYDYVLIARQATARRPHADLVADLTTALERAPQSTPQSGSRSGPRSGPGRRRS